MTRFHRTRRVRIVDISTHLKAPVEQVWNEVNKPRLLEFVAHPVVQFIPVEPEELPEFWADGDYIFKMRWHGFLPMGRQVIGISRPAAEGGSKYLRDNGRSALAKRWDHLISVSPEGDGTRYSDRIEIEAGILTPLVAAFAHRFYSHRQRRWNKLVASGFEYGPD